MEKQFPKKNDEKATSPGETTKDTESSISKILTLTPCSSNDLDLPSTPKFFAPSQGGSRFSSVSPGVLHNKQKSSISLGEVNEPIDEWISKTMEKIESALVGLSDFKEDGDDSRFNLAIVERLQKQANEAHERSMTELPKVLQNLKKTKPSPKKNGKETKAKKKPHLRAISELRPSKIKPRHKRDNESVVPLDIMETQIELVQSLSKQKSAQKSARTLSRQFSVDVNISRDNKGGARKNGLMSSHNATRQPQHQHHKSEIATVTNRLGQVNQKKESEVIRELLQKINDFRAKIEETDAEIKREEESLVDLGGGPHLKQQVEQLKSQLQDEPTSSEILKAKERNRALTRERDEHLALTTDLLKENVELREKIRLRNEQLAKLSTVIQNYASKPA